MRLELRFFLRFRVENNVLSIIYLCSIAVLLYVPQTDFKAKSLGNKGFEHSNQACATDIRFFF